MSTIALVGTARTDDWFEALYRASAADLHAYAASLLRDRVAAEDVVSLAFERAYRRRRLFNARRGTARAWLFAIARNAALDELRRRKRDAAVAAGDDAATEFDDDAAAGRIAVRAALAQLHARDRELLLLKFHGQLTNAELGRVIGTSETNAGTRLHRALNRLREGFDEAA